MDLDFDVVDLEPSDHPAVGETAPDFTRPLVTAEDWGDESLGDLCAAGPVLLLFHPMAGAFPATYIWNEISDRGWEQSDTTIVGLSISTPYEHKTFIETHDMSSRLFSDPQNEVAQSYDIVHDLDGMAGVAEPRPAAFILEPDRTVRYAWVAQQWPDFPDYDAIADELDSV